MNALYTVRVHLATWNKYCKGKSLFLFFAVLLLVAIGIEFSETVVIYTRKTHTNAHIISLDTS